MAMIDKTIGTKKTMINMKAINEKYPSTDRALLAQPSVQKSCQS